MFYLVLLGCVKLDDKWTGFACAEGNDSIVKSLSHFMTLIPPETCVMCREIY